MVKLTTTICLDSHPIVKVILPAESCLGEAKYFTDYSKKFLVCML